MPKDVRFVVILGHRDRDSGLWRFFHHDPEFVGVPVALARGSVEEQLQQAVVQALGGKDDPRSVLIRCQLEPDLVSASGVRGIVFLAELLRDQYQPNERWQTMPDILRKIPKDRNRISLMKVIQILSQPPTDTVSAVEFDDALIQDILKDLQD